VLDSSRTPGRCRRNSSRVAGPSYADDWGYTARAEFARLAGDSGTLVLEHLREQPDKGRAAAVGDPVSGISHGKQVKT
jgi:hypothetical protein